MAKKRWAPWKFWMLELATLCDVVRWCFWGQQPFRVGEYDTSMSHACDMRWVGEARPRLDVMGWCATNQWVTSQSVSKLVVMIYDDGTSLHATSQEIRQNFAYGKLWWWAYTVHGWVGGLNEPLYGDKPTWIWCVMAKLIGCHGHANQPSYLRKAYKLGGHTWGRHHSTSSNIQGEL